MTNGTKRPLALIILDGWGYSRRIDGNAIAMARTPVYDGISSKYPMTGLSASGERVGLSINAPGNAEIGHMSIGAGRIVQTDVSRIEQAVNSGQFFENEVLKTAFAHSRDNKSSVHLIGLLSNGGIHSSMDNLFALLRMAKREGAEEVFVHGILDGRDVQPRTADVFVEALEIKMADIGVGKIASLCGRFFAMDSGENWERTARAYTMLVHLEGERSTDAAHAIRSSFLRGISDEFISPIIIESEPGIPMTKVRDGDTVIFFNHRADAMKQLARSLSGTNDTAKLNIKTICLTEYDGGLHLPVAFKPEAERNMLAQIFEEHSLNNYRITETERFSHITDIFNGGADFNYPHEQHLFVPASSTESRESEPESKSFKITNTLLRAIEMDANGVFIVNIPAVALLAETGNLQKTIEAVQFVDTCLGGVLDKVREANGIAVITSSHGSCIEMPNAGPAVNTVPFHIIDDRAKGMRLRGNGALEDIAPTILGMLGIDKPSEMTGSDLRVL